MSQTIKGQVIVPTGGGKTMCMIIDAQRQFSEGYNTIVVVAPRILLAQQLSIEFLQVIDNVNVLHVHSGETEHYSTTKLQSICDWFFNNQLYGKNGLIFTTYH